MNKALVSITLNILIVLFIALLIFNKAHRVELPPVKKINVSGQPTQGQGKITIVIFEDMKCGNCKRYNTEIHPYIQAHYIATGQARYIMIPLAFLPNSTPAANAALCIYQQKPHLFFTYVDYAYQHQPNEALDWTTPELLINYAKQIPGVDVSALIPCIKNHTYDMQLQKNLGIAAQVMGDTISTPRLYINGYEVAPLTLEQLNKVMKTQQ